MRLSARRCFAVAQNCILLYHRIAFGRTSDTATPISISEAASRLQTCDTAECNSALQGSCKPASHLGDSSLCI